MSDGYNTMNELRAEIATLQRDLASVSSTLRKLAGQAGEKKVETVREIAAGARDRISEASATAERSIAERPFTSTAVAFGLGFLIGKLLERR